MKKTVSRGSAWSRVSRETHSAIKSRIQDVEKPCLVGGERTMYPYDPAASAGNEINCGCQSIPYIPTAALDVASLDYFPQILRSGCVD